MNIRYPIYEGVYRILTVQELAAVTGAVSGKGYHYPVQV